MTENYLKPNIKNKNHRQILEAANLKGLKVLHIEFNRNPEWGGWSVIVQDKNGNETDLGNYDIKKPSKSSCNLRR